MVLAAGLQMPMLLETVLGGAGPANIEGLQLGTVVLLPLDFHHLLQGLQEQIRFVVVEEIERLAVAANVVQLVIVGGGGGPAGGAVGPVFAGRGRRGADGGQPTAGP